MRGVLDQEPDLVPIKSVYTCSLRGSERRTCAQNGHWYQPICLTRSRFLCILFQPLALRVDNDPEHSIRVTTDISFDGTDSTLTRSRLYSSPGGRLLASIFNAYDDVSFALVELMTRDDYAVYVREAEVQVEVIPETRFATVGQVTA